MAPELSSALAKDAANFGAGLLRGTLLDSLAQWRMASYQDSLTTVAAPALGNNAASRDNIGTWIEGLYLQQGSTTGETRSKLLAAVVAEEKRLQAGIRADDAAENEAAKPLEEAVNEASLTSYLQRKLNRADIAVTSVRLIPGGGSKITRFISTNGVADIPSELIMRQDYAVNHVGNSITGEYPLLVAMHAAGLPVAPPLFCEGETTSLGAPFMMVHKVEGQNIGNLWGFFPGTDPRPVCLELARVLAAIHQLRVEQLNLVDGGKSLSLRDRVLQQIDDIHRKWASGRGNVSPVIALSLLWLVEHLDTKDAMPALVHADCAFTNILVHDGKMSALLDWEFAHIGDPAEDLAYVKDVVEKVMPWQEFVDVYCAAGGRTPSAHRLHYFNVWRALRNVIYAGLAGESFLAGGNNILMLGWAGIYAVPLLEQQLINMIGDAWQVESPKP